MRNLAVLGTVGISFSAILVRLSGASAATSGFFRMAYAVPILLLLAVLMKSDRFRPVHPAGWIAGGIFALNLLLWHLSIDYIGAGLATVLGNTQVVFIALLAWLFMDERPGRTTLVVLPVLMAGVVLLTGLGSGAYGTDPVLGVILGASSGLTSAAYVLVFRHASRRLQEGESPVGLLLQTSAGGAVAALLLGLLTDPGFSFSLSLQSHGWLVLLAAVAQVAGWLLLSKALRKLPALDTAVIMLLQPVLALVWSNLIFSERLSPVQVVGVVTLLAGIAFLNVSSARRQRAARQLQLAKELQ